MHTLGHTHSLALYSTEYTLRQSILLGANAYVRNNSRGLKFTMLYGHQEDNIRVISSPCLMSLANPGSVAIIQSLYAFALIAFCTQVLTVRYMARRTLIV